MPTDGEREYFRNIGADGMRHATHKPWSDLYCGAYLMELGAIMGLLPPKGKLLDLGCGTGWTSVMFAQRGFDVVGQDLVPEAIEAGHRLKAEHGLTNLDFLVADYESLDLHEQFDFAVFFDSLHHAVDEAAALASAYRALKPGGLCITSEPGLGHERRSKAVVAQYGVTERDMHPGRVIAAGKKSGFKCVGIYPHAHYLHAVLYRRDFGGWIGRLLRAPGMSTLAAFGIIAPYRYADGIVVLQK
jgi:SAM-dependent methyltransferase